MPEFNHKNGLFDGDEFIWKIKNISDGNSHLCYWIYSLICTKVHVFVSYIVTSKVIGIGAADSYLYDVTTIKPVKISATISNVSYKQIIVHTYDLIESTEIEQYHYDKMLLKIFQSYCH